MTNSPTEQIDELYEVWLVPHETDVRNNLDLKFNTFEKSPDAAIEKVRRYLVGKNHVSLEIPVDYVVHRRPLVV